LQSEFIWQFGGVDNRSGAVYLQNEIFTGAVTLEEPLKLLGNVEIIEAWESEVIVQLPHWWKIKCKQSALLSSAHFIFAYITTCALV